MKKCYRAKTKILRKGLHGVQVEPAEQDLTAPLGKMKPGAEGVGVRDFVRAKFGIPQAFR